MTLQPLRIKPIIWLTLSICSAVHADTTDQKHSDYSVTTPGLSVKELTLIPQVIFGHELKDVPGKNLVVVSLEFPPTPQQNANSTLQCMSHRHPGSVYVYITKGTMRFEIAGQAVQILHEGQSFFEPPGALHTLTENASGTETAAAIAVLIMPEGAPILTREKCTP